MPLYIVSFGVSMDGGLSPSDQREDAFQRQQAAYSAAFSLGLAWHGGQSAVFLQTEARPLDVIHAMQRALGNDLVVVAEICSGSAVHFSGTRFDEDGFDSLFPKAVEVPGHSPV